MSADLVGGGLLVAFGLLVTLLLWRRRRAVGPFIPWPSELRTAHLVHAERLFTAPGAMPISARVDRAYRVKSGGIVLLELKTREADRAYLSDVIELSAQRVALGSQTGERVADHAWVMVQRPGVESPGFHRVKLMPTTEVLALAWRREAILAGRSAPRYSTSDRICGRCPFVRACERHGNST